LITYGPQAGVKSLNSIAATPPNRFVVWRSEPATAIPQAVQKIPGR
jgi:hypothetical protein